MLRKPRESRLPADSELDCRYCSFDIRDFGGDLGHLRALLSLSIILISRPTKPTSDTSAVL